MTNLTLFFFLSISWKFFIFYIFNSPPTHQQSVKKKKKKRPENHTTWVLMYTSIEEEIQRMCNKSLLENLPYNRNKQTSFKTWQLWNSTCATFKVNVRQRAKKNKRQWRDFLHAFRASLLVHQLNLFKTCRALGTRNMQIWFKYYRV